MTEIQESYITKSLEKKQLQQAQACLKRTLKESKAKAMILMDRSGHLVSRAGRRPTKNMMDLMSLIAANIGALSQLAVILGEASFSLTFQKGHNENVHCYVLNEELLLATFFNNSVPIGRIRFHSESTKDELCELLKGPDGIAPQYHDVDEELLGDVDPDLEQAVLELDFSNVSK
jgi:hypothetical protein